MKFTLRALKDFLADRFSLNDDNAHHTEVIDSISRNVEFKGSNLWALIFAIFIASIGLNVNSTAVIIGAMLVSPLMGPIMGVGLGLGINDIELVRKAFKNLLIAVVISIAVSSLYFFITPLAEAQSELLNRTTPSIWDVFIALFGGLAGIIGGTRKEKSNVIPGVAIATALMPPLCTAGYGLATGHWYYFFGAFYLFFINSVFICISSYIIVKYLQLPKKIIADEKREKRVNRYILYVVIATALPSIYLTYKIVDKSIFESNAARFVKNEFKFKDTHILNKTFRYENGKREIYLLVIGEDISAEKLDSLKAKLAGYNLGRVSLIISQGLRAKDNSDFSQIKATILEDLYALQEANKARKQEERRREEIESGAIIPDLSGELKALYPTMINYSLNRHVIRYADTTRIDSIFLFIGNFGARLSNRQTTLLRNWLKTRIKADTVGLILGTKSKPVSL